MSNQRPRPRLIEQTAKRYKLTQLCGLCLLAIGAVAAGLVMQLDTTARGEDIAAGVGIVVSGSGFVVWLIGAGLAWWNHS